MKSKMALGSKSKKSLKQGRMICVLREKVKASGLSIGAMKNIPVRKVKEVNLVLLLVFCMQVPAGTLEKLFFYVICKSKEESKSRNNS